jgi:hypothetical protein
MADARYAFGSFVLDAVAGVLNHNGEPLPIGQRGAALLTALLEANGEAVSKDELLAKGWPGLIVQSFRPDRHPAQGARPERDRCRLDRNRPSLRLEGQLFLVWLLSSKAGGA